MTNVLMVPYLYFKDFSQSSGVLHQMMIAKALSQAGMGVTVVLPAKEDGWVYSESEYIGAPGHAAKIGVVKAHMAKDQHMWTGFWADDFLKLLSPMRTNQLFDVVLNMIPPMAGGIKRLLCEVGFSRLDLPVVNVFDTVTVPKEAKMRGGNLPQYLETLKVSEVMSVLQSDMTVLTTFNEMVSLKANMREVLSPSTYRDAAGRVNYLHKPLVLPKPKMRTTPEDGVWRVFMGRSFGKSFEEGGNKGEQVASVVEAIRLVAATHTIKLVLCTRSPLDGWAEETLNQLAPENLELVHNQPRDVALQKLEQCQIAIDLRDYDGLYMAALEQQASGAVTVGKPSKWSQHELSPTLSVVKYDPKEIAQTLIKAIDGFDDYASHALGVAEATRENHDTLAVGAALKGLIDTTVKPPMISPSMSALLDTALETCGASWQGSSFNAVKKDVLACTQTGNIGRFPDIWLMKALIAKGCVPAYSYGNVFLTYEG